jgi:hypothetical protein
MIPEPISAGLSYSTTHLLLAAPPTGGERVGRRSVPGQDGQQRTDLAPRQETSVGLRLTDHPARLGGGFGLRQDGCNPLVALRPVFPLGWEEDAGVGLDPPGSMARSADQ